MSIPTKYLVDIQNEDEVYCFILKKTSAKYVLQGVVGKCGSLDVFLGFAPANLLHSVSFADVLDEETGQGYQRPPNRSHSLDFKKYITRPQSSTIPLTFNLRNELKHAWHLQKSKNGTAVLHIDSNTRCLAQVDCQHRLSELRDVGVSLAFMCFIGLDFRDEMAQFVIINSKAKGLSSSLTDFHQTSLVSDLVAEAPHLFIAKQLNEDPNSPWFKLVRYGGETTSGLRRRTSFRMMQKAILRFLSQTKGLELGDVSEKYSVVCVYWKAIRSLFPVEWADHRHHLITKGVGLHALTRLLGDILLRDGPGERSIEYFHERLSPLSGKKIDWSSSGPFAHAGGQKGVQEVHATLREALGY
jgi:DGQHR domain-containing protein